MRKRRFLWRPCLKKRFQRLRLALSKGSTSVLAPPHPPTPILLQVFICQRKKGQFPKRHFLFVFSRSSKTDRNQIILNSETSDSAKAGERLQQLKKILEGLADNRQSTPFSAFYDRQ